MANAKAPAKFVTLFEGFQQFDGDLNKLQVWFNAADTLNVAPRVTC